MITYRIVASGPLLTDPTVLDRFDGLIAATLEDLGALGQRFVVARAPRGVTDGLRGSIYHELRGAPARRQEIVSSSVFYAPIVELGRQPGKRPPVAALLTWVSRKFGLSGADAQRAAFLVSRKIGAQGYKGYRMFERAAEQLVPIAQQRFRLLEEQLRRLLAGD